MVLAGYALLMGRLQVEVHPVIRRLHTCICEKILTGVIPSFPWPAQLTLAWKSLVGDIRTERRLGVMAMC